MKDSAKPSSDNVDAAVAAGRSILRRKRDLLDVNREELSNITDRIATDLNLKKSDGSISKKRVIWAMRFPHLTATKAMRASMKAVILEYRSGVGHAKLEQMRAIISEDLEAQANEPAVPVGRSMTDPQLDDSEEGTVLLDDDARSAIALLRAMTMNMSDELGESYLEGNLRADAGLLVALSQGDEDRVVQHCDGLLEVARSLVAMEQTTAAELVSGMGVRSDEELLSSPMRVLTEFVLTDEAIGGVGNLHRRVIEDDPHTRLHLGAWLLRALSRQISAGRVSLPE